MRTVRTIGVAMGVGLALAWLAPTSARGQSVVINEFLASNSRAALRDSFGEASDWIELHNPTPQPVNLGGWRLSDRADLEDMWVFPSVVLPAGGYLVVFASGRNTVTPGGEMHTSFSLAREGEYLALVATNGLTVVHEYAPTFPEQERDVSYGILEDRVSFGFFAAPTPGAANAGGAAGIADAPQFSRPGGTATNAFLLSIASATPGAVIRVTTDRSIPTTSSPAYTSPLSIGASVQIRARVYAPGMLPGPIVTHTYVLLAADVVSFSSDLPLIVVDCLNATNLPEDSPDAPGYVAVFEPDADGRTRLTSLPTTQSRAGLRRRGESTMRDINRKPHFAVDAWQDDSEEERNISPLGLPAEADWVLYAPDEWDGTLLRTPLGSIFSNGAGQYASRWRFVEVYLRVGTGALSQAHYAGIYVLLESIRRGSDRVDIAALRPEHDAEPEISGGYIFRGDKADATLVSFTAGGANLQCYRPTDPTATQVVWLTSCINSFKTALDSAQFTDPTTGYAAWIDVPSWIDVHLVMMFSANVDWPVLSAYYHKDRQGKIRCGPVWDFDRSMDSRDPRDDNPEVWEPGTDFTFFGSIWWNRLFQDPNFWQLYTDRWVALRRDLYSDANILGAIDGMTNTLAEASARNVARWNGTFLYCFGGWAGEVANLRSWLLTRAAWIDSRIPPPPSFDTPAGLVAPGTAVRITLPPGALGTIYYTTDGTDPRAAGGAPSASAAAYHGETIPIEANLSIKARVWDGQAFRGAPNHIPWSAPTQSVFVTIPPQLAVSEVHVRPRAAGVGEPAFDEGAFEFVELTNIGDSDALLWGVRLADGIEFDATTSGVRRLAPGDAAVVVANLTAFQARYGATPAIKVLGTYSGRLDNAGERLRLEGPLGDTLCDLTYASARGWPVAADGAGHSLVPLMLTNQTARALDYGGHWRASAFRDGSPGRADPTPPRDLLLNEFMAHTDYSGPDAWRDANDWIELFNASTQSVAHSNWYLSHTETNLTLWPLPPGGATSPGGFALFDEVTGFRPSPTTGFGLSKDGERLFLSYLPGDGTDRVADATRFKAQRNDISEGRHPDGGPYWFPMPGTPGATNAEPYRGAVIAELMVDPAPTAAHPGNNTTDEYVKLYNPTAHQIDLWFEGGPCRLGGVGAFTFPLNTSIPAGGLLLVVPFDPADTNALRAFTERYALTEAPGYIHGPFTGELANRGERIALECPQWDTVPGGSVSWAILDEVIYATSPPWPANARTNDNSLHRVDMTRSGNDPSNWTAQPAHPLSAPPSVVLIRPEAGALVRVPSTISAEAIVNLNRIEGAVHRVDFFLDGTPVATDAAAPFTAALTRVHMPRAGEYRLRADVVHDGGTNRSVETVLHAVWGERITLLAPAGNIRHIVPFSDALRAAVNPEFRVGDLHAVRFLAGTNVLGSLTAPPFELAIDQVALPPTGWHELRAVLEDDFGASTSAAVRVFVYESAYQDTYTWTGGGTDAAWTTAGNWIGAVPNAWNSDSTTIVAFAGTPKTITAVPAITLGRMTFNVSGFNLSGGGPITMAGDRAITVASNVTATINVVIGGLGLIKDGNGTLKLDVVTTPPVAGAVLRVDAGTLPGANGSTVNNLANLGTRLGTFSSGSCTLNTGGINGKKALQFNGTSDFLKSTTAYANTWRLLTMFIVSKRISNNGGWKGTISCWPGTGNDNDTSTSLILNQNGDNGNLVLAHGNGGQAELTHPGDNVPFISTGVGTCCSGFIHYLKTSSGSSSAANGFSGAFNIQAVILGNRGTSDANFANINIGEVLIYNSELSAADRLAVESYLAVKWGIGAGAVTVNGGALAPGGIGAGDPANALGSALAIGVGGTVHFDLAEPGSTTDDQIQVAGAVTLGGTLTVSNPWGTMTVGTYRIMTCSGTPSGSFATINMPSGFGGTVNTGAGFVDLEVIALPTYTITYNANGATSGTVPASQTKTQGILLTLASNSGNLARTGYTFAGWNTAAAGNGTSYAAGANYTANVSVTLYAKWAVAPRILAVANNNANQRPLLQWIAAGGATYTVLKSTNLLTGWSPVFTGSAGTAGSTNVFTDTNAVERSAFYKIRIP